MTDVSTGKINFTVVRREMKNITVRSEKKKIVSRRHNNMRPTYTTDNDTTKYTHVTELFMFVVDVVGILKRVENGKKRTIANE